MVLLSDSYNRQIIMRGGRDSLQTVMSCYQQAERLSPSVSDLGNIHISVICYLTILMWMLLDPTVIDSFVVKNNREERIGALYSHIKGCVVMLRLYGRNSRGDYGSPVYDRTCGLNPLLYRWYSHRCSQRLLALQVQHRRPSDRIRSSGRGRL